MTKKKSKSKSKSKEPPPLVPRAGPPTNLRPGGPHAGDAGKSREIAIRTALRILDVDDDAL
jgi:hypothetical protein